VQSTRLSVCQEIDIDRLTKVSHTTRLVLYTTQFRDAWAPHTQTQMHALSICLSDHGEARGNWRGPFFACGETPPWLGERVDEQVGARRRGMVEATEELSFWNSDKWISHWALAGKGDTDWWRGVFPAATATTVASQAKLLGPVGNEHVKNEHAGGLTALGLRELRRKEQVDKHEKMFASETAARIMRSTFHAEARIRPFSFCTTERAQYLIEAIFELETEATNLAGQVLRLAAELVKPCQGQHGGGGFCPEAGQGGVRSGKPRVSYSLELGELARSGDDSPAGGEEPSATLVQRRRASRTRPQD
jgi:hypothetical protein